jgi:hypothetical protein
VHPIESYLEKLAEIRASGHATDETSYYPAIEVLLAEIGKRLKPRVLPVLQLKNQGAGLPDGGLFTQDQFKKNSMPEDFTVQPPNRGVVEVKGLSEETSKTVQSEQVKKYLRAYGQVLLTNYREFRVVVLGKDDKPRSLETFTLAKSEAAFWALAAHPRKAEGEVGKTLEEFLTRALLSAVPITSPDVLASFLASYAREAWPRSSRAPRSRNWKTCARRWKRPSASSLKVNRPRKKRTRKASISSAVRWCRRSFTASFPHGSFGAASRAAARAINSSGSRLSGPYRFP